ncbi:hypothetical protein ACEQPO_10960 [Bacillus sp. SL00103]
MSLTYEEISLVSEHLDEPGVNVINDWTRKYPGHEKTLYNVLGGGPHQSRGL